MMLLRHARLANIDLTRDILTLRTVLVEGKQRERERERHPHHLPAPARLRDQSNELVDVVDAERHSLASSVS